MTTLVLFFLVLLNIGFVIITLAGSDYQQNAGTGRKLATQNPGFISIDCGATEAYYDENTGIFYQTDRGSVDTGTIGKVSSEYNIHDKQFLNNLRSFPNGTRNCYILKPQHGKNKKYLIRAFFLYGNYDGRNQFPTFKVYIGVNFAYTMKVTSSLHFFWREAIHIPSTDYINVCLINTGNGTPFISALELRTLNNSTYQIESADVLLPLVDRYDLGSSSDKSMRYKDDVYDRLWHPLQRTSTKFTSWDLITTPPTTDFQSSNDTYKPPAEVLRNAAQTQNASTPLSFGLPLPTPLAAQFEFCTYLHFAEISNTNGQLRKQYISSNGVNHSTPFTLFYLKPKTIGPLKFPIIRNRLNFSIHATEDSDLPPILNALEIYRIYKIPISPTDPDDVDAMMHIKQQYELTRNWQGDPCVPNNVSWEGLNCSDESPPRIISLNLTKSGLTGNIAASISNLKSLKSLDLSYNELTGPLPKILVRLPHLKTLDLRGNKLKGLVPQALMEKFNNGTLQLSLDENPNFCQLGMCEDKKNKKIVVPVVASASIAILILLMAALAIWWNCKRKGQGEYNEEGSKKEKYTYSEILGITNNLETFLGGGGFGEVYLGTLENGNKVAVKVLSSHSRQGRKEFQSEVDLLMKVRHENVLKLIGYCDDSGEMALIYEYMDKDLKQHLLGTSKNILNWNQRLRISLDVAKGLEYMHKCCNPPIIHRDFKPSNILINENYQAKIADFGLSRNLKNEGDTHVTTSHVAGSIGYMDPEYQASSMYNKKSDVYSFGIVLLELITGQPVINDDTHIVDWVSHAIESGDIQNVVDWRLQGAFNAISAQKAVELAISCIPRTAIQRPDMTHVVAELEECLAIEIAYTIENDDTTLTGRHYITRKLNKKSDFYSFGVVLLELITGHPVVITVGIENNINIIQWVRPKIARGDIGNIVDPNLRGTYNINSAWKAVEVAMAYVPQTPIKRPEMSYVLVELKECLAIELRLEKTRRRKSDETLPSNSFEISPIISLETEMGPMSR